MNSLPYKACSAERAIRCSQIFAAYCHIPSSFSTCAHVARPCPQCKNLDNISNNMNSLPYKACSAKRAIRCSQIFAAYCHIPSSFSTCAHVARPCPQCENLDNIANNMNYSPYKACSAKRAISFSQIFAAYCHIPPRSQLVHTSPGPVPSVRILIKVRIT